MASTPFAAGLIVPAKRTAIGRRYKLGRVAARRPPLAPWSLVDAGTRDLLAPDWSGEELRPGAYAVALCDPFDAPLPDLHGARLDALGLAFLDAAEPGGRYSGGSTLRVRPASR